MTISISGKGSSLSASATAGRERAGVRCPFHNFPLENQQRLDSVGMRAPVENGIRKRAVKNLAFGKYWLIFSAPLGW
jgi:hypothetical protein